MFFAEILLEIKSLSNTYIRGLSGMVRYKLDGIFLSTFVFVNVTMIMLQHTK